MTGKKMILQFVALTFAIAYSVSGVLIVLGQFGYRVYNWVDTLPQFAMNIPFAIYILSPAIASYIVLKKNKRISGFLQWLKTVFYAKNHGYPYLFMVAGLVLYFATHALASGETKLLLPFYTLFLSLPGNLFIGGLEEAGWMVIMQPGLEKKLGFVGASALSGFIWVLWYIPLFFIPGTNHGEGLINFWMFTVQVMAFRFFFGALYKISGKSGVFLCILFHTLFNAASPIFGAMTTTWAGTIAANAAMVLVSIITVGLYNKIGKQKEVLPFGDKVV